MWKSGDQESDGFEQQTVSWTRERLCYSGSLSFHAVIREKGYSDRPLAAVQKKLVASRKDAKNAKESVA